MNDLRTNILAEYLPSIRTSSKEFLSENKPKTASKENVGEFNGYFLFPNCKWLF